MRDLSSGPAVALLALASAMASVGCGGDGIVSDPGTGTRTLAVQASASYESGLQGASFEVRVSKLGQAVSGAKVAITSGLGMVTLVEGADQRYRGNQAGWPDDGFILDIEVRDATGKLTDSLSASVRVAAPVKLMRPSVTTPFDPHTLAGGVLDVVWSGPAGDRVRVKAKDFEPQPFSPDPLKVSIPATTFGKGETEHDLEITRSNTVLLAGGAPDSSFTSDYKLKTTLIVTNPFP